MSEVQIAVIALGAVVVAGSTAWGVYRAVRSITKDYVRRDLCDKTHKHQEQDQARVDKRIEKLFDLIERLNRKVLNGKRQNDTNS